MHLRRLQHSVALIAIVLAYPDVAMAHTGDSSGGMLSGFTHPINGFDHVLAMVAVGLWGAQLGNPAIWLWPVTFPLVMAIGGFCGLIGLAIPGIEIGIAASAIVMGAMIALEAKPKLIAAMIMVGLFAIFHGHAHGTELPEGENGILYSIGFVIGTGLLHAAGIILGLVHRWNWGQSAIRLSGLLIAIGGCYFFKEALS